MKQGQKKILFLITKSNMGGAQRYLFDIVTRLSIDEFDPVVAFGNAQGSNGTGVLSSKLTQSNIRVVYLPSLARDITHIEWNTFKEVYRLLRTERPDILHLNSSKAGGLGALAARLTGVKKIIFTAHGWPFFEKRNMFVRTCIFLLSYLTVVLSHTTICICEYDARAFGRMPFVRDKIKVIQNGIAPEILLLDRNTARNQLHISNHENDVWITSIGELTTNKNISLGLTVFAEVLKKNQNLFYVIIGDGEQREKLVKLANKLGLTNKVHFVGQLPDAAKYLSGFDILFLPSQKEGLPYVLLEAGSAGVPVIASYVGGVPEIISNGVSGYVRDASDINGFTEALLTLANDAEKREQFGKELQRTIIEKYSLVRMIEQTKELYKK